MNGKQQAMDAIRGFLNSTEKGILITGTHQYKKHILAMAMIDQCCQNAHVLFRINALYNINGNSFLGCLGVNKQPKAGERIKIGKNVYEFDSFNNTGSWYKTSNSFDFAIVYPIDALARDQNIKPIEDIVQYKRVGKLFLCSCTDGEDTDYPAFKPFFDTHVVYDAEEEDPAYHNRVLGYDD